MKRKDKILDDCEVQEAKEVVPPAEERKKELQQSISDRLGRLSGIRTIVSNENPFKR